PGQSLAWGAWREGGMASRLKSVHQARLARQGVNAFSPAQAMSLLASVLVGDEPQLVLLSLDVRAASKAFGTSVPPLFRSLVRSPRRAAAAPSSWAQEIAALPEARRYDAVYDVVRVAIARALARGDASPRAAARPPH